MAKGNGSINVVGNKRLARVWISTHTHTHTHTAGMMTPPFTHFSFIVGLGQRSKIFWPAFVECGKLLASSNSNRVASGKWKVASGKCPNVPLRIAMRCAAFSCVERSVQFSWLIRFPVDCKLSWKLNTNFWPAAVDVAAVIVILLLLLLL